MKVVYLDQNKWIELARAWHEKTIDKQLKTALAFAKDASQRGTAVFPLSAIHYMETAKIRDVERRARLGKVMQQLSHGYTMASYHDVVVHELEAALTRRFPEVRPGPFQLVGKGVEHALGLPLPNFRIPEPLRSNLSPRVVAAVEEAAQSVLEEAAITGRGAGLEMPAFTVTAHNVQFRQHLETLHPDISQLPREQWEDGLHAMSLVDILDAINEVLQHHGLTWERLGALGKNGLAELVDDLPSRRVDLQLHRQVLKNPHLKPKDTHLEDWSGLGPAAAHCDVVICEKHFADLLLRDGFRPKASILTDVRLLPDIC